MSGELRKAREPAGSRAFLFFNEVRDTLHFWQKPPR